MVKKGLVLIKTENDLQKEELAEEMEAATRGDEFDACALAAHIKTKWESHRNNRTLLDERLLYCLRSRKGEYSADELARILSKGGVDPVFIKLTGVKCRAASAWIRDIILPANEDSWSIAPTTIPQLPPETQDRVKASAVAELQAMNQEGMNLSQDEMIEFVKQVRNHAVATIEKDAKEAARNVSMKIKDQMEEGDFQPAMEEFIEDFVTYPAAFLKGPFYKRVKRLEWDAKGNAKAVDDVVVAWRRVSPFDAYPSPYARTIHDGDFIERIRLQESQLYDMIGLPGYSEKEIRAAINEYKGGKLNNWLWSEWDKEQFYTSSSYFMSDRNTIDALHFWGKVKGTMLLQWGTPPDMIKDPDCFYEIDAILVGRFVVRAVINDDPLGTRPYNSACWDAMPSAVWGVALPEHMRDDQAVINACARSLCTNMAIAAGPQVTVLVDRLAEGEDITDIYPLKVWQGKSSLTGTGTEKPVDFFQPDPIAAVLLSVMADFERRADETTNVPRYSYGNERGVGGAGQTASGLSMLMNSAAKGIRRAIANIDSNVISKTVYQTFVLIMLDKPDPALRGDCKVVAKGAAAILIKDMLQQQRKEFLLGTANEYDQAIMGTRGRATLLRLQAKELGLDEEIVPSDLEMKQKEKNAIPPELQQMQAELQQQAQDLQAEQLKVAQAKAELEKRAAKVILDEAKLESQKASDLTAIEEDRRKLDAKEQELEADASKNDLNKIRLDTLEKALRADSSQREAELERRLAQSERRVGVADANSAIAKVNAAIAKATGRMDNQVGEQSEGGGTTVVNTGDAGLAGVVAAAMETLNATASAMTKPRKIVVQRDANGNLTGATSTVE